MLRYIDNETRYVADVCDLQGNSQGNFAITSGAGAQSPALPEGLYDVWCDVTCYIKVATSASDVTSSTGYIILSNNIVPLVIHLGEKIGAIASTSSGTFRYHRVSKANP
jgi:hypothetical protein